MNKLKGFFNKGKSGSKQSLHSASFDVHGYDIKDKDLSKIHKAAWTGDIAKVKQLAKKDPNALDKENRYIVCWYLLMSICHLHTNLDLILKM